MLSRTPRRPRVAPCAAGAAAAGSTERLPKLMLEKVVREVEGVAAEGRPSMMWKEVGKEDSKNCSRSSSASTTMRNVGSVMCSGFAGSRAALAASDCALETLRSDRLVCWLPSVELMDSEGGFFARFGLADGDSSASRSSSSSSSSSSFPMANAPELSPSAGVFSVSSS
ncbi:hypothetical protein VDGD_21118 [Verticillium dahliae]|nr:hypothetical protein VDGD_21118 [Verticillium dahliae]